MHAVFVTIVSVPYCIACRSIGTSLTIHAGYGAAYEKMAHYNSSTVTSGDGAPQVKKKGIVIKKNAVSLRSRSRLTFDLAYIIAVIRMTALYLYLPVKL